MKKKHYNFVYLTNTPSFYKINLCKEICKKGHTLLLVLYGYGSEAVNTLLTKDKNLSNFDFIFINEGDANKRNKFKTFGHLLKLINNITYDCLLYSGWLAPEYNAISFLTPKSKNVVVSESSIWDISMNGLTGAVKKAIINRMAAALPSGKPHNDFFSSINFKGKTAITGSVGIFHKPGRIIRKRHDTLRYLYVGRLIDVKNVGFLINEFNKNGKPLTIVGTGELEKQLKEQANDNITFTGFINNEKLGEIYQEHDVFILPSKSETWGLVVEEALYWGLPVIVSDRVGSATDMVRDLRSGLIFKSGDPEDLHKAIQTIETDFDSIKSSVEKIDWTARDKMQVQAYETILDSLH